MCKHTHTTPVLDALDDGTFVIIHQCDMCGMLHWRKPVDTILDPASVPPVDLVALERAYRKLWREIFAMPLEPPQ